MTALAGPGDPAQLLSLPNLIIAGVSKAGTTSLFRYLAQHPDVSPSDVKELRYFQPLRHGGDLEPLHTYASHFADRSHERYAMEATPGYFYGGRALAEGLNKTLPEARVVVSLRDPVERCWSWYSFMRSRARIEKSMSFETYLDRCESLHTAGTDGEIDAQPFWGLGGGCYARWVDAWYDVFGDRFTVIFFEDLVREPHETIAALCHWLSIDVNTTATFRYGVENKTEQYRSKVIQQVALQFNRSAGRFFERHLALKRRLRQAYYTVNRQQNSLRPSAQAVDRLRDFYLPHNENLARSIAARQSGPIPSWVTRRPHANGWR
jgi:Sulfotransferase family